MPVSFEVVFFGITAGIAVILAILMLAVKSPIHSALSLIGIMVMLAVNYLMLHAYFIAAVQIVVYAGAVMVLFLYVIMFFYRPGVVDSMRREAHFTYTASAIILSLLLLTIVISAFVLSGMASLTEKPQTAASWDTRHAPVAETGMEPITPEASELAQKRNPELIGELLYSKYLLPFELTSLLLLAAMIGAVVLTKRAPDSRADEFGGASDA
jgi:NADH-quinone oxidoreductase subunit J